ncbi:MAG: hypothetical protein ACI9SE_002723, partial [Neolewinella sp.]
MTPKLIRSVAAACLAAALLPAQEEHEVTVRVSGGEAKASSKASVLSSEKLSAIIEKLSDDELSSADRKKLKSLLMKVLDDVSGKSSSQVVRLGRSVGREVAGKIEKSDLSKRVEWAELIEEVVEADSVKGAKKAGTWIESVKEAHDHVKGEHGKAAGVARRWAVAAGEKPVFARAVRLTDVTSQSATIAEPIRAHEHHADVGIEVKAHAIARLGDPDSAHDAIAYVYDSKDGDGKAIHWVKPVTQGQGKAKAKKAKKAKGSKLGARARQLRARLNHPAAEESVAEWVLESATGDLKSHHLSEAKKAYAEAKRAYDSAMKAHDKASGRLFGTIALDDVTNAQVKDGTVTYFRNQTAKQNPKKGKAKAKKDSKKVDSFTFEWTSDTSSEVSEGGSKSKSKSKGTAKGEGGTFVFDTRTSKGKGGNSKQDKLFKFLKQSDAERGHGIWVVGGEGGQEGHEWITEIPGVNEEVLLELLQSDNDDSPYGSFFKFGGGKANAKANHE